MLAMMRLQRFRGQLVSDFLLMSTCFGHRFGPWEIAMQARWEALIDPAMAIPSQTRGFGLTWPSVREEDAESRSLAGRRPEPDLAAMMADDVARYG